MRPLHILVILITVLLLSSCHHGDFTQRKYLPFFFKTKKECTGNATFVDSSTTGISVDAEDQTLHQEPINEVNAPDSTAGRYDKVITSAITHPVLQPTDSAKKKDQKKSKLFERRPPDQRNDGWRSQRTGWWAVYLSIYALIVGTKISDELVDPVTGIFLTVALIFVYIPAGIMAVLSYILGGRAISLGKKYQRENADKTDYPDQKRSKNGIILGVLGLILTSLALLIVILGVIDAQ